MMDAQKQRIVMSPYVGKESYPSVAPLLASLKKQRLKPWAVTVDGHPHVIRAFTDTWPMIIIQRCLCHIQREGMRWLRFHPKTEAGKELRSLLKTVTFIRSVKERDLFLRTFGTWQRKYGAFVRSLPRTSVAFKDLKRTVALINNARAKHVSLLIGFKDQGNDQLTRKLLFPFEIRFSASPRSI